MLRLTVITLLFSAGVLLGAGWSIGNLLSGLPETTSGIYQCLGNSDGTEEFGGRIDYELELRFELGRD